MPSWNNIDIQLQEDSNTNIKQFEIELNRRLRYYLNNIDASQITSNLNDIPGILRLSKGGTGNNLSAPASDRIFFYDVSDGASNWLDLGSGLSITDTTLNVVPSSLLPVIEKTITHTLLISEAGLVEYNSATAITSNLQTAVGNEGITYTLTNVNTGVVTIDPNGTETIMGDATFDLYQYENIQITSNNVNWVIS